MPWYRYVAVLILGSAVSVGLTVLMNGDRVATIGSAVIGGLMAMLWIAPALRGFSRSAMDMTKQLEMSPSTRWMMAGFGAVMIVVSGLLTPTLFALRH